MELGHDAENTRLSNIYKLLPLSSTVSTGRSSGSKAELFIGLAGSSSAKVSYQLSSQLPAREKYDVMGHILPTTSESLKKDRICIPISIYLNVERSNLNPKELFNVLNRRPARTPPANREQMALRKGADQSFQYLSWSF